MVIRESGKGIVTDDLDRVRYPAIKSMHVRIKPTSVGILFPAEEPRQFLCWQNARSAQESLNITLRNQNIIFRVNKEIISVFSRGENALVREGKRIRVLVRQPCDHLNVLSEIFVDIACYNDVGLVGHAPILGENSRQIAVVRDSVIGYRN